jgi:hypothetical protein
MGTGMGERFTSFFKPLVQERSRFICFSRPITRFNQKLFVTSPRHPTGRLRVVNNTFDPTMMTDQKVLHGLGNRFLGPVSYLRAIEVYLACPKVNIEVEWRIFERKHSPLYTLRCGR